MNWRQYFPILNWIKEYRITQLRSDVIAGITVGIMVIPQGMAYGFLAQLPPIYGLYAALVPMIIYALLGTSRQLIVGPTAMVCLLIAMGVQEIAAIGSPEYLGYVLLLSFSVGCLQFLFGVLRLGFFVNFLSHPVLSGFLSAAAIIIIISQLKNLTGSLYESTAHTALGQLYDFISQVTKIDRPSLGLGVIGMLFIFLSKRIRKSIPGPLIVLVLSIIGLYAFHDTFPSISILGDIPSGLPAFQLPSFQIAHLGHLAPAIFTISLIGMLESIAIAKQIQAKNKTNELQPNQELRAIGIANIIGAFFQAFPAAGSVSRTAVNEEAGATSGIAAIVAAVVVSLTLLFLTPLFYYLPKAILAAIIIVAVVRLIDIKEARFLWSSDKRDFGMLLITFLATLFIGIEQGILIGIFISLLMVLYKTTRPHITFLGRIPETDHYKNANVVKNLIKRKDLLIIRPDAPLYFANISHFKDTLLQAVDAQKEHLQLIIFNADCIPELDSSATHALREVLTQFKKDGITFYFTGISEEVYTKLKKSNVLNLLGGNYFFENEQNAVDYYDKQMIKKRLRQDMANRNNSE